MDGRRSLVPALLRDRVFRRYWSASTISMFGDQISGIALPLAAVLALHVGAAQMGYLTALEWLPSLLFGLPAGAWVDRRGRRRMTMIGADLSRAALLGLLFAAEFWSGFGVMVLDISIGAIFAAVIPDPLRSRVTGAFQAVNYGTRPAGALLGGLLGTVLGLRSALWIAAAGGTAGFFLLLLTPLPRFRMPAADVDLARQAAHYPDRPSRGAKTESASASLARACRK
jgi:MFS family permease